MTYELLAIFPNAFSDEDASLEHKKLLESVSGIQGTIVKDEIVGRKRLAYPVRSDRSGIYSYIQFELDQASVAPLEKTIRLNAKTRRFSITKFIPSQQRPMPLSQTSSSSKRDAVPAAKQELKPEDIAKLDTKIEEFLNEEIK